MPLQSCTKAGSLPNVYQNFIALACSAELGPVASSTTAISKVPEGHHPRGTTLHEALRGNLPLRGLCASLSEGSAGALRGFCGVSAGFCGGPQDFPRFFGGSDPMLVILGNCWSHNPLPRVQWRRCICCSSIVRGERIMAVVQDRSHQ